MEKRISHILLATLLLFTAFTAQAQAPGTTDKVLMETPTGAAVYQYSNIKTDIQAGTVSAPAAGIVKSNGTALQTAVVRTDYAEPTTALATGLLKNTTSTGAHTIAVAGTDYLQTLSGDVTTSGQTATIAANAVTTAKILDANVTTAKIADVSVTGAKLATGAVDLASTKVTGLLPNANLANASITINGTAVALGGTRSITLQDATTAGATTTTATTFSGGVILGGTTQTIGTAITTAATAAATDNYRVINCTTNCTITIPTAAAGKQLFYKIAKTNVGTVTFASSASETFDTLTTYQVTNNGASVHVSLTREGTNWAVRAGF